MAIVNIPQAAQVAFISAGGFDSTSAAVFAVANTLFTCPVNVSFSTTVTGVMIDVGTASGNVSVALYDSNGNRLATSGAVACPAAGARVISFTSSAAIAPGYYFLALSCDNVTATFTRMSSNSPLGLWVYSTAHPAPATLAVPGTAGSRAFWLAGIVTGGISQ